MAAAIDVAEISTGELIAAVGASVKAARSRRGVTRRNLARHASISERYLTELEAGRANASLSVIHRVALALGLNIGELIPSSSTDVDVITSRLASLKPQRRQRVLDILVKAAATDVPEKAIGVALVGLRGAGKSTLGAQLARKHNMRFVRLRDRIEQLGGQQLGDLVSLAGQRAYRRLEKQALMETIEEGGPLILEVGGSLVTETETYAHLLSHFYTVWICAEPDDHLQRVVEQGDRRPMAGSRNALEDIKIMLSERDADYRRAHSMLNTHGQTIQTSVQALDALADRWLRSS